jgi:hypothetical protein
VQTPVGVDVGDVVLVRVVLEVVVVELVVDVGGLLVELLDGVEVGDLEVVVGPLPPSGGVLVGLIVVVDRDGVALQVLT